MISDIRIEKWRDELDHFAKSRGINDGKINRKQFIEFTAEKEAKQNAQRQFPRKLSETGIFASTKDHKVAAGVIPYSVNAQLWGDHASKERFIAIPGNGQIGFDEIDLSAAVARRTLRLAIPRRHRPRENLQHGHGTRQSQEPKRLETRILHFQQFPGTQEYGDQYWRGYTYVWNDDQTDAELLDAKGLDKKLTIKVGDKMVEQNYRFPSRAECTLCHTNAAKFALGVSTMQMNRDHNYGGVIANQFATLEHIGMFTKKLPKSPAELPKLADYNDDKLPVDVRARSYLHSNCAHCHMKWGGGNAEFKLLVHAPAQGHGHRQRRRPSTAISNRRRQADRPRPSGAIDDPRTA